EPVIHPPLLLIHEYVDAPIVQELAEHVDVARELDAVPSVVPGKGERVQADARLPEHAARPGPAMAQEQVSRGAIGTALEAQVVDLEPGRSGAQREPPIGVAAFLVNGEVGNTNWGFALSTTDRKST